MLNSWAQFSKLTSKMESNKKPYADGVILRLNNTSSHHRFEKKKKKKKENADYRRWNLHEECKSATSKRQIYWQRRNFECAIAIIPNIFMAHWQRRFFWHISLYLLYEKFSLNTNTEQAQIGGERNPLVWTNICYTKQSWEKQWTHCLLNT